MQQSPCLEARPPPPEYSWMTWLGSFFTLYLQLILVEFHNFFCWSVSIVLGGDCTGDISTAVIDRRTPWLHSRWRILKWSADSDTHRQVLTYDGSYNTHTHTHTHTRARARARAVNLSSEIRIMSSLPPLLFQPFLPSLYISLWRNVRPTRCAIKVV